MIRLVNQLEKKDGIELVYEVSSDVFEAIKTKYGDNYEEGLVEDFKKHINSPRFIEYIVDHYDEARAIDAINSIRLNSNNKFEKELETIESVINDYSALIDDYSKLVPLSGDHNVKDYTYIK